MFQGAKRHFKGPLKNSKFFVRSSMCAHLFDNRNISAWLVDVQEMSLVSVLFPMIEVCFCLSDFGFWDLVGNTPSNVVLIRGMLPNRGGIEYGMPLGGLVSN